MRLVDLSVEEATYDGEAVDELASQYWYNIVMFIMLVVGAAFVTEFTMMWGIMKKWSKFTEVHISQFTRTSIPVPAEPEDKFGDKIKVNAWIGLLLYRITILVFCIGVWIQTLVVEVQWNLYVFSSFYTLWNFTMLVVYFAVRLDGSLGRCTRLICSL